MRRRLRAAWEAFRNPDVLNVVVAPHLTTTQHVISEAMAREIRTALQRYERRRGGAA